MNVSVLFNVSVNDSVKFNNSVIFSVLEYGDYFAQEIIHPVFITFNANSEKIFLFPDNSV